MCKCVARLLNGTHMEQNRLLTKSMRHVVAVEIRTVCRVKSAGPRGGHATRCDIPLFAIIVTVIPQSPHRLVTLPLSILVRYLGFLERVARIQAQFVFLSK